MQWQVAKKAKYLDIKITFLNNSQGVYEDTGCVNHG